MNKILKVFFILIFSFLIGNYTLADYCKCAGGSTDYNQQTCRDKAVTEGCEWVTENTPSSDAPVPLTNPLTGTQSSEGIPVLLGKIINSVMGIIGSLALVMFIYGGVSWMLSAGNQEQVTKGKNILIWATAGLVIIFTAYALVKFVLTTVTMTP